MRVGAASRYEAPYGARWIGCWARYGLTISAATMPSPNSTQTASQPLPRRGLARAAKDRCGIAGRLRGKNRRGQRETVLGQYSLITRKTSSEKFVAPRT